MTLKQESYRNGDGKIIIYFSRLNEKTGLTDEAAPGYHYAPVKNTDVMIRISDQAALFLIEQEHLFSDSVYQRMRWASP